jgi:hypothetical protein
MLDGYSAVINLRRYTKMMYSIIPTYGGQYLPQNPAEFSSFVNAGIERNWLKIQQGYANPNSSTGRPMEQLNGAAYNAALFSNIGIPRNQGGTGMRGGYEATMNYAIGQALWAGYNICCWYYGLPMLPPPCLT